MKREEKNKTYLVMVNGNTIPNLRVAARLIDISYNALYNRVMRNNHYLDAVIKGFSVTVKEFSI